METAAEIQTSDVDT